MNFHFLVSSERSGSNFLSKILNSHSDICGPSIKHIINPLAQNLFRYKDLNIKTNKEALIDDLHTLLNIEFSVWKTKQSVDTLRDMFNEGDVADLIKKIFSAEAQAHSKNHICIKENHIYKFMPFLLLNFPDSKYIYNVRDPRDVALSWKKNTTHKGGIITAAKQWKKDQIKSLQLTYALQPLNKIHLIKYENLITQTEETLEGICHFLDLEFEPTMLDFHTDKLTIKNSLLDQSWRNLSNPVIKNNREKYKEELSNEEIAYIEKICYLEMKWFNYSVQTPKTELDAIETNELNAYHEKEISSLPLDQRKPLVDIMKAKAAFYNRDSSNDSTP